VGIRSAGDRYHQIKRHLRCVPLISTEAAQFWGRLARWASRLLSVASIWAGVALKLQEAKPGLLGAHPLLMLAVPPWWALPILLLLLPLVEWFRRYTDRVTLWPIVKSTLEDFRRHLFGSIDDPTHHHRVTLFKRCWWVWRIRTVRHPAIGWVKIFERTGHTTQNSRTVYRAPNNPDLARGIAGTTWAWNKTVFVEELPDLSGSPAAERVADYAKRSNCDFEDIRSRLPRSRSLCGFPIEVKGRVWGVLVVDSRNTTLPRAAIEVNQPFVAKFLGRVLERL